MKNVNRINIQKYARTDEKVSAVSPNSGIQEILDDLRTGQDCDNVSEAKYSEIRLSSIKNMGEICEKLLDIQNFLFNNYKNKLAVNFFLILSKCGSLKQN